MGRSTRASRFVQVPRIRGVASATMIAAGTVFGGLVAWPVMDGFGMPNMVRLASWWNARALASTANSRQHPQHLQLREHIGQDTPALVIVDSSVSAADVADAARERPICVLDMECVPDCRVMTWSLLNQLVQPTGFIGTAVQSYVRAVYIAASLLTGNQGTEHTDYMFYLAFLDYMSNAVRHASTPSTRPVIVVRHVEDIAARAARVAENGDADRARLMRRNLDTLLAICERLSIVDEVSDCVLCVNPCDAKHISIHPSAKKLLST